MKDLTKTMEISMRQMEEEQAAQAEAEKVADASAATPGPATGAADTSTIPPETSTTGAAATAKEVETEAEGAKAHTADVPPTHNVPPPVFAEPVAEPSAVPGTASPSSGTSTPRNRGMPIRPAIMDRSEEEATYGGTRHD